MKYRENEPPDWNEHENFGPLLLRELDEHPGDNVIDKSMFFGSKGAIAGGCWGAVYASIFQPAASVNGLAYAVRQIAIFGSVTGASGLVLGASIPIIQAIRNKNDPMTWMMGGFAAGAVFALKSGQIGRVLKYGSLVGGGLALTKWTGTYQRPYVDPWAALRKPKPEVLPLFDKDGNMYMHRRMCEDDL